MPPAKRNTRFISARSGAAVPRRGNRLRSPSGLAGLGVLIVMLAACLGSLPWTLGSGPAGPRYSAGDATDARIPPVWATDEAGKRRIAESLLSHAAADPAFAAELETAAAEQSSSVEDALTEMEGPAWDSVRELAPAPLLGTDLLGRSLFVRVLTGGGISLLIGVSAALLSVFIGTVYGAIAGYAGGRIDDVMMRIVDVLFGLPYILLVVLLAVAVDALAEDWIAGRVLEAEANRTAFVEAGADAIGPEVTQRQLDHLRDQAQREFGTGEVSESTKNAINIATLLVAIGGVSWLTMARVIRGQVMSLKSMPYVEAARAAGASPRRIFARHLLPNLVGPVVVYATLSAPQAILQESFLSFLGIGVKPPLPSWGSLAAEGLSELNTYRSHWWLLAFPCLLLGITLMALNFVGEGLREAIDPRRATR